MIAMGSGLEFHEDPTERAAMTDAGSSSRLLDYSKQRGSTCPATRANTDSSSSLCTKGGFHDSLQNFQFDLEDDTDDDNNGEGNSNKLEENNLGISNHSGLHSRTSSILDGRKSVAGSSHSKRNEGGGQQLLEDAVSTAEYLLSLPLDGNDSCHGATPRTDAAALSSQQKQKRQSPVRRPVAPKRQTNRGSNRSLSPYRTSSKSKSMYDDIYNIYF